MKRHKFTSPIGTNWDLYFGRLQGWRIRGFEGARAPPERTSAPLHRQKHPLKIKQKLCKIPCDTKIEQKYGYLRLNLGK